MVLVATNGSPACRRAVARAAELFEGSQVVVATVVPGPDRLAAVRTEDPAVPELGSHVRVLADRLAVDAAAQVLADACAGFRGAEPLLLDGDPASSLVDAARRCQAGTLVIGSLARRGLATALRSSVGVELARRAPCPVIELG